MALYFMFLRFFVGIFIVFLTCFYIYSPVLHVFGVFFSVRIFVVFLTAFYYCGPVLCVFMFFLRAYSWFFTGFLISPYESRTAGNQSPFSPSKRCPNIRIFNICGIVQERIPCECQGPAVMLYFNFIRVDSINVLLRC